MRVKCNVYGSTYAERNELMSQTREHGVNRLIDIFHHQDMGEGGVNIPMHGCLVLTGGARSIVQFLLNHREDTTIRTDFGQFYVGVGRKQRIFGKNEICVKVWVRLPVNVEKEEIWGMSYWDKLSNFIPDAGVKNGKYLMFTSVELAHALMRIYDFCLPNL